jgi:hypothetical protein
MNSVLLRVGQLAGLLGMLLMAVSVVGRLGGRFVLGNFQTGTMMLAGIAGVSVGCFLLLWALAARAGR